MKASFLALAAALVTTCLGGTSPSHTAAQAQENSFSPAQADAAVTADLSPPEAVPGFPSLPEFAIEGAITKSERVSRYLDTPWASLSQPVGLIETVNIWEGNLSAYLPLSPCTAWLIDLDLALTAYHCIPGLNSDLQKYNPGGAKWRWTRSTVSFNYISEDPTIARRIYDVEEIVEANRELDYAILRLRPGLSGEFPGQVFGAIRLASNIVDKFDDPVYLFHHPYGYFKLLLKDSTCRISAPPPGGDDHLIYHSCDTRGGSSGAPILTYRSVSAEPLAPSGRSQVAIGLHTNAGFGVRIPDIVAVSPMLKELACYPDSGPDYGCPPIRLRTSTVYFASDMTTLGESAVYESSKVRAIALALRGQKPAGILITGYTDTQGSAAYNVRKSERMAKAVSDALVALGIDPAIVRVDWKGEAEPAVATGDGVSDGRNRRVTVIVEWPEPQQ